MGIAPQLNTTYISPRLAARLEEIEHCRLTTVVAPMGYGKSTAVRWWASRLAERHPEALVLRQTLTEDGTDVYWRRLCRVLRPFPELSEQLVALGYPDDRESALLMTELLEDAVEEDGPPVYYVLDDAQHFTAPGFSGLLTLLVSRLPQRVRVVLVSRNRLLRGSDRFKLGVRLCQITMDDLRLRRGEIVEYARACGIPMDDAQARTLEQVSEGWVSLLYLLFSSYAQQGRWLLQTPDIFRLMDQVMFEPLDERKRRFLLVNGLSDDFTREQAAYLWQEPDSDELLDALTQENAFIAQDGGGGVYRYHNMLRDVVGSHFRRLPEGERRGLLARLGEWQLSQGEYEHAAKAFYGAGDWERLIDSLVLDRSKSFGAIQAPLLKKWCTECPEELLLRRPDGLLVMMLDFYTFYDIPEMLRMYGLFQQCMEMAEGLAPQERNNLLGEAEIMLSFLDFNDITAMSAHHRRACELMDRPSYSMGNESPWTFGCPSILMTYHRAPGDMDLVCAEMRECIPYYSRVTEGHGSGAEHVMEGEACLVRGDVAGGEICYHRAALVASPLGQFSILACSALLAGRLALLDGRPEEVFSALDGLDEPLRENRQYVLLPTMDLCRGWLLALLGRPEKFPAWLLREDAAASFLTPVVPMLQMVVNQVLLASGSYSQVVARWEELHGLCEQFSFLLCDQYLRLQTAAALYGLGRPEEADPLLDEALAAALPDRAYLPFAEVDDRIAERVAAREDASSPQVAELLALAERYRRGRDRVLRTLWERQDEPAPSLDLGLSQRELQIARMAAQRKTNQEIAAELFLSERTVKNHLNRVYDKLGVPGMERNKRARLAEILGL